MKFASIFGHVPTERKLEPWDGWPLPKCKIGLEWEFEFGALMAVAVDRLGSSYITSHRDGSLRDSGIEIVTTGDGLFGVDLDTCINVVEDLARQSKVVCTYRTGFHVHLDIRDLEEIELHNLLLLYCLLEKPIFNFVGRERWKNNFCVPWFRSDSQFPIIRDIAATTSPNKRQLELASVRIKGLQRYSALNCQSIAKFGTLEFRHLENNVEEIQTKQREFIKIVMLLKKFATRLAKDSFHGPKLWEWLKELTPRDLMREFGYSLDMTDWDYPEALMAAVGLVAFPSKAADFSDVVFDNFIGNHANWR